MLTVVESAPFRGLTLQIAISLSGKLNSGGAAFQSVATNPIEYNECINPIGASVMNHLYRSCFRADLTSRR